jgi:para-nitrobenzyl esterase
MAAGASLQALRDLSASEILKKPLFFGSDKPMSLGVVTDGYVFPKPPAEVFRAGQEHRVGLMIGNNARERVPNTNPPGNLPSDIAALYGPLSQRGISLYAASESDPLTGTPPEQWSTDKDFRCPAVAQLVWHAAAGNPAYEFQFSRVPPGRELVGATHASEIPYVFGTQAIAEVTAGPAAQYNSVDRSVSEAMQQYWTNFARTGDPNGNKLPRWPGFDVASRAYIEFVDAGPAAREGLRRPFCDLYFENVTSQMAK